MYIMPNNKEVSDLQLIFFHLTRYTVPLFPEKIWKMEERRSELSYTKYNYKYIFLLHSKTLC